MMRAICLQLVAGLGQMHHQHLSHMDIKLENILINDNGLLQYCDFGFTVPKENLISSKMGTKIYMAPEIYNAKEFPCRAQATDIFSLGVLFFMLAFGVPPFHSAESSDGFFCFLKARPDSLDFFKFHPHTRLLYRDNKIPVSFMKMLLSMLRAEPSLRVQTTDQILMFEFFQGINNQEEVMQGAQYLASAISVMA